jgi:hypothetical protein
MLSGACATKVAATRQNTEERAGNGARKKRNTLSSRVYLAAHTLPVRKATAAPTSSRREQPWTQGEVIDARQLVRSERKAEGQKKKKKVRARVLREQRRRQAQAKLRLIARSAEEWGMGWRTLREQADDDRRLQSQHSAS